ncbi:MAG: DNA methyltransferase, partial [Alphaproteobacteria bacterium]
MTSLLEQLPKIVANGKREAERIMERLESTFRVGLQTRELVIPSRDTNAADMLRMADRASHSVNPADMNRLIYGDNLLAMAAMLAGSEDMPSMRGKVDLIYIDPPFDSKADYRTKINLLGGDIEQIPTAIEQFAYSDTWQHGTASFIATMTPRLCLFRELLSDKGSIFVHLDWHVVHYVKIVLDEIFGKSFFLNEIIYGYGAGGNPQNFFPRKHDNILWFSKNDGHSFNKNGKIMRTPYDESTLSTHYKKED